MTRTRRRTRGGVPTPPRPPITARDYLASQTKARTPSYIGPKNPQNTAEDIKKANERRAAATKAAAAAAVEAAAKAAGEAHDAKYKALTDAGNLFRKAKERTAAARAAAAAPFTNKDAGFVMKEVAEAEAEEARRRAAYMTIRQTYSKVANNSGVKLPPPDHDDDAGLAAAFRNLGRAGRRRTRRHKSRRRHTKPRTRGRKA